MPAQPDPALLRLEREAGVAEGRAAATAELKAALDAQQQHWRELCDALRGQLNDPQTFIDPLARLALHFARLLSRAALDVSDEGIRSLVGACLDELGGAFAGAAVRLHPEDFAQVQRCGTAFADGVSVMQDTTLSRGSVRVVCGDAVIDDLAEARFAELLRSLLGTAVQSLPGEPLAATGAS
jgi:flagellar biosynthesis/type III secretory pathway protein FliH